MGRGPLTVNVFLASFPRSGSTWTRQLVRHHYGFPVPAFVASNGRVSALSPGRAANFQRMRKLLVDTPTPERKGYVFWRAHFVPRKTLLDWPMLLVVRDGRDAYVSGAHYRRAQDYLPDAERERKIHTFEETLRESVNEVSWATLQDSLIRRRRVPPVILRYEDLLQDPLGALREAMTRLLPTVKVVNEAPLPGFERSHKRMPGFFRRGEAGAWRDEMPEDIHELFWSKPGHVRWMEKLNYER